MPTTPTGGAAGGSYFRASSQVPQPLTQAQQQSAALRRPLWRLVALLGFFLAIGTWALVNECRAAAAALGGQNEARSTVDMPNVVLTVIDALILGNVLSCLYPSCLQPGQRKERRARRVLTQRRQQLLMDQQRRRGVLAEHKGSGGGKCSGGKSSGGKGSGFLANLASPGMLIPRKRSQGSDLLNSGVVLRPRGREDRQLQVFASTFNAGSTKNFATLGPVEAWIPIGFDLYVIVS